MEILSIISHTQAPHLGGINGVVQYDLDTLALNNGEKLQDFHRRIISLPKKNTLYRKFFSYNIYNPLNQGIVKER